MIAVVSPAIRKPRLCGSIVERAGWFSYAIAQRHDIATGGDMALSRPAGSIEFGARDWA
jgi:hypothetical protein